MTPAEVDHTVCSIFRVKRRDTLPYTGWLKSTREDVAKLFNTLEYKVGAEIGVWAGNYSKLLFNSITDLKLILVDPWAAYNKMRDDQMESVLSRCQKKLAGCNAEYMRMTSLEAAALVPDKSLDFIYIDGLHEFDPVMRDIIYWSRKVRPGGIIAGHDYYEFYQGGVIQAVNAYTRAHNINDWYLTTAEQHPTWFWVQKESYQQGYSF